MNLAAMPLRYIQGVSAQKEQELHAFGIHSVEDLLLHFPYRYEDYRLQGLADAAEGDKITVVGTVVGVPAVQHYGRAKSRLSCRVAIDGITVSAVWFNRPYLRDKLMMGRPVVITGKWEPRRLTITVAESAFPAQDVEPTSEGAGTHAGTLQPVYSVGGTLTQKWLRGAIAQALKQFAHLIEEIVPQPLIAQHRFMSRREAIETIHRPLKDGEGEGLRARRTLVYEEFFQFQLKIQAYRRWTRDKRDGIAFQVDSATVREFASSLPWELTNSQKKVINEIIVDMRSHVSMNRLVQGDVGSGKTVVAATALHACVRAGYQGAMMVPTEILAEQHKRTLSRLLEPFAIRVELLVGSMPTRERKAIVTALEEGTVHVVVGTHALIQSDIFFHALGLVVTDEQHRFGVNQRSILRRKGLAPDVLTMTATPIPRTLAITAFGDMDVSTIKERPAGRKPIITHWVKQGMMERVLGFIQREIGAGRQAYFICPLIEESDKLDVQNAIDLHADLSGEFPQMQVGLLHGRLNANEKDEVMAKFANNEVQVLVATTVVEVGVDVPNATLMIVMDADRFGLSQLHQLRGRVGRGQHQSYCVLIADPKSEAGRERMKVMVETDDGFEVSRRDLELRGPGDYFGTKQSGVPEFKIGDISTDFALLEQAREDAAELVNEEQFWDETGPYGTLLRGLKQDVLFAGELLD